MPHIRELKRKLRFKLLKLEEAKFDAYVKAFRLIRNKILDDSDTDDKPGKRAQFEAEDAEAGAKTAADRLFSRKSAERFRRGRRLRRLWSP
ncbi:hypothetical protein V1288_000486 [Bradyrhizobium sp. AZCC 2176]